MTKMNAWNICAALAKRHTMDMFFTEVKNGPSWIGRHSRIDALAIKKSWLSPCISGYEVKVNRSDFVQDNKWQAYLEMCNELYFVCPKGLIALNEVPEQCGLKYVYESGMIKTVKKAPYRQIEHPTEMYLYLLMKYVSNAAPPFRENRYEQIEAFLADKVRATDLAVAFSSKLVEKVAKYEKEERQRDLFADDWAKDKAEYKEMVELLKKHTGSNYLYKPSRELKKILDSDKSTVQSVVTQFEEVLNMLKEKHGLNEKEVE